MSLSADFSTSPPMRAASEISLRQSSRTFGQLSKNTGQLSEKFGQFSKTLDTADHAHERMCDVLRQRHPTKTGEGVEADTFGAVTAVTVRKWFDRASRPGFVTFLALTRAYGAEFLVAVMGEAPDSLLEAAIVERRARYEQRLQALESKFGLSK